MKNSLLFFVLALVAYAGIVGYHLGHWRGVLADVDVAARAAFQEGFNAGLTAGADWENNKHSLSCNGA